MFEKRRKLLWKYQYFSRNVQKWIHTSDYKWPDKRTYYKCSKIGSVRGQKSNSRHQTSSSMGHWSDFIWKNNYSQKTGRLLWLILLQLRWDGRYQSKQLYQRNTDLPWGVGTWLSTGRVPINIEPLELIDQLFDIPFTYCQSGSSEWCRCVWQEYRVVRGQVLPECQNLIWWWAR